MNKPALFIAFVAFTDGRTAEKKAHTFRTCKEWAAKKMAEAPALGKILVLQDNREVWSASTTGK